MMMSAPAVHIGAMHRGHGLRHGQVELLRRLAGLEAALLQHGAHGPVQDQDPLADGFQKWLHGCPFFLAAGAGGVTGAALLLVDVASRSSE